MIFLLAFKQISLVQCDHLTLISGAYMTAYNQSFYASDVSYIPMGPCLFFLHRKYVINGLVSANVILSLEKAAFMLTMQNR